MTAESAGLDWPTGTAGRDPHAPDCSTRRLASRTHGAACPRRLAAREAACRPRGGRRPARLRSDLGTSTRRVAGHWRLLPSHPRCRAGTLRRSRQPPGRLPGQRASWPRHPRRSQVRQPRLCLDGTSRRPRRPSVGSRCRNGSVADDALSGAQGGIARYPNWFGVASFVTTISEPPPR